MQVVGPALATHHTSPVAPDGSRYGSGRPVTPQILDKGNHTVESGKDFVCITARRDSW